MKFTFHSPKLDTQVSIECNDEAEFQRILGQLIFTENIKTVTTVAKVDPQNTKSNKVTSPNHVKRFLDSLYIYQADKNTPVGRGRYMAEYICDMQPHTIQDVVINTGVCEKTIQRTVKLFRQHGAKVVYTKDHIHVETIPAKNFAKKRRATAVTKTKTTASSAAMSGVNQTSVINALSALKVN